MPLYIVTFNDANGECQDRVVRAPKASVARRLFIEDFCGQDSEMLDNGDTTIGVYEVPDAVGPDAVIHWSQMNGVVYPASRP